MFKSLGKIQYYIIPLVILGFLATCDTDFGFDNTQKDSTDSSAVLSPDTLVADSAGFSTNEIAKDSVSEEPVILSSHNDVVPTEKMWRVVIASISDEAKLQKIAASLGASNSEIVFVPELNTYRLVYDSHTSLHQAQNTLEQVQGKFPDAWLIYF